MRRQTFLIQKLEPNVWFGDVVGVDEAWYRARVRGLMRARPSIRRCSDHHFARHLYFRLPYECFFNYLHHLMLWFLVPHPGSRVWSGRARIFWICFTNAFEPWPIAPKLACRCFGWTPVLEHWSPAVWFPWSSNHRERCTAWPLWSPSRNWGQYCSLACNAKTGASAISRRRKAALLVLDRSFFQYCSVRVSSTHATWVNRMWSQVAFLETALHQS